MERLEKTKNAYSFLWSRQTSLDCPQDWHFNLLQEIITEPMVRGKMGIDVGSGCGYDTCIMARNNPAVNIVSLEVSDGIYNTKKIARELFNIRLVKSSVLSLPFREDIFDFAYSYGVLHHSLSPRKGLEEIWRVLKKHSPVFLYLYEDHSENVIKYVAVRVISLLRNITVRVPPKVIYFFCWLFSPVVFLVFSVPAKILGKSALTRRLANNIPFNFGRGFFSLREDLYDRFSAPVEHRFSKQDVYDLFVKCGFYNVNITRLNTVAGWVAWGYKG